MQVIVSSDGYYEFYINHNSKYVMTSKEINSEHISNDTKDLELNSKVENNKKTTTSSLNTTSKSTTTETKEDNKTIYIVLIVVAIVLSILVVYIEKVVKKKIKNQKDN